VSLVSVIVPTLNEEKLLPAMLRQFTPTIIDKYGIELIVSDGGSTDRTLVIAKEFAHKVIENSDGRKQTISIGRNEGAAHAGGAVLVFLNADTLIESLDFFLARVTAELRDPAVCALTCSVEVYPSERIWSDALFHGFYNWLFSAMNSVGMSMGRGECHVIRGEAFRAVGGYSSGIAAGEDYDMFRKLGRVGGIKFPKDLLVYESPRRYRRYGYTYVTLSWFYNFLSVFFLGRSILDQWKPVR